MPGFTAGKFLAKQPIWKLTLSEFPIQQAEQALLWIRLVAHGVSIRDFTGPEGLNLLVAELRTFNPEITFFGSPRWITDPNSGKLSGSFTFTVGSKSLKKGYLKKGI